VDTIRRLSTAQAIAAVTLGLVSCMSPSVAVSKDDKSEIEESDKQIEQWLSEPDKAEARRWLESDDHILFEGDKETAAKLVGDLHIAGAKQVWVIGVTRIADSEVAAAFVAVLPADAGARKQLFALESDFRKMVDGDPTRDVGQKYLHFSFD
jgi:hypothetical protein